MDFRTAEAQVVGGQLRQGAYASSVRVPPIHADRCGAVAGPDRIVAKVKLTVELKLRRHHEEERYEPRRQTVGIAAAAGTDWVGNTTEEFVHYPKQVQRRKMPTRGISGHLSVRPWCFVAGRPVLYGTFTNESL